MRLWAALALAAALAAAKKTESSQDTKYEIDKLQALVDNKKTLFDSLEATLRRASESDGAAAEEAKAKAQQRLEEGSDISEDEAKALAQAILYSEAQLKAKRHRG